MRRSHYCLILPEVPRSLVSLLIYWAVMEIKRGKFVKRSEILDILGWNLLQLVVRVYYYRWQIAIWKSNNCFWIDRRNVSWKKEIFQNCQKDEITRCDLLQVMRRSHYCLILPEVPRSLVSLLIYWAVMEIKRGKFVKRSEILDILGWNLLQLVVRVYCNIIAIAIWTSNDDFSIDRRNVFIKKQKFFKTTKRTR